jgi:hypothetical protein
VKNLIELVTVFVMVILALVLHVVFKWNLLLSTLIMMFLTNFFIIIKNLVYNCRSSLKPEPIPTGVFGELLKPLNLMTIELKSQGFDRIDDFYFQVVPDAFSYVFKHKELPCHLYLYSSGGKISIQITSFFKDDYALSSYTAISSGNFHSENKSFLQIYPNAGKETLLEEHLKGLEFLKLKGLKVSDMDTDELIAQYKEGFGKTWEPLKKNPLWPFIILYRYYTNPGKIYVKPIEQQFKEGIASLDDSNLNLNQT